jgi:hypothetical protein
MSLISMEEKVEGEGILRGELGRETGEKEGPLPDKEETEREELDREDPDRKDLARDEEWEEEWREIFDVDREEGWVWVREDGDREMISLFLGGDTGKMTWIFGRYLDEERGREWDGLSILYLLGWDRENLRNWWKSIEFSDFL